MKMTKKYDDLNDAFDVNNDIVQPEVVEKKIDKIKAVADDIKKDYDYTRGNLYSIIEKGQEALNGVLELAQESEQPRAYEVIATLVKNVSDASDKLMDVNKKLHEIEIIAEPEKNLKNMDKLELNQQNNTYYVGSTADLQELINNTMADKTLIEVDKDDEEE